MIIYYYHLLNILDHLESLKNAKATKKCSEMLISKAHRTAFTLLYITFKKHAQRNLYLLCTLHCRIECINLSGNYDMLILLN